MTNIKRGTWLASTTAAILVAGSAVAFAQTTTSPTPNADIGGCSSGNGADMTQCQGTISNQQKGPIDNNDATNKSDTVGAPDPSTENNAPGSNNNGVNTGNNGAPSNAPSGNNGNTGGNQGNGTNGTNNP